jgi:nucleoid-associated protein YgaU
MKITSGKLLGGTLTAASMLSGNAKAMLLPERGGLPVMFTLNPKSVSLTKENKTEGNRGVVASTFKEALKATGNVRLKLKEAHLTGAVVTQVSIDQLVAWATPTQISAREAMDLGSGSALDNVLRMPSLARGRTLLGGGRSSESATKESGAERLMSTPVYYRLPVLLFMWGVGGPLGGGTKVNLEKVDVDYQRFDWTGVPVWAKVTLTLVEYSAPLANTNPTSAGVPGRSKHVLTQGENVVQVATGAYGSPDAWRTVAEANGLDDPLRLKPGRTLVLPAPGAVEETS